MEKSISKKIKPITIIPIASFFALIIPFFVFGKDFTPPNSGYPPLPPERFWQNYTFIVYSSIAAFFVSLLFLFFAIKFYKNQNNKSSRWLALILISILISVIVSAIIFLIYFFPLFSSKLYWLLIISYLLLQSLNNSKGLLAISAINSKKRALRFPPHRRGLGKESFRDPTPKISKPPRVSP